MPNIIINKNHLLVLFSHSFYSIFDFFNRDPECIWSENILCHASILDFFCVPSRMMNKMSELRTKPTHISDHTREKKKKCSTTSHNVRAQDVFNVNEIMHRKIWYFTFQNNIHTPDWNSFALKMGKHKISAFCETRWTSNRLRHIISLK